MSEPLLRFSPPAHQDDFGDRDPKTKQAFLDQWSRNVKQWTERAMLGDPWTVQYDSPRSHYINPLNTPIPDDAVQKRIDWVAFPNRINLYFENSILKTFSPLEPLYPANKCPIRSGN